MKTGFVNVFKFLKNEDRIRKCIQIPQKMKTGFVNVFKFLKK